MILQALCQYYERTRDGQNVDIAEPGFSREKIHAEIVLDKTGKLVSFNDLRIQKGNKLIPREMIVPQAVIRTVVPMPNFAWDNTTYVLGADAKGNPPKSIQCFAMFRSFHHELCDDIQEPEAKALLTFLDSWKPETAESLPLWDELASRNIVFRMDGERHYLHEKSALKNRWIQQIVAGEEEVASICLINGEHKPIARLHPSIKGVQKAQSSGARLVTFNLDAFCSYGKKQNFNAPISKEAAFSYATALNYLLARDSRQKIQIGDATTVFWTDRESPIEGVLGMILNPKDVEAEDNKDVRLFLEAIRDGKRQEGIDPDVKFYILGISPNAARLAVRFWHVCSVGELEERIGQHFRDLQMQRRYDSDPEYPGIRRILWETYNKKSKTETASPLLSGALMKSILEGTIYPQALQNAIVNRIRADREINYVRAAILKAILVRKNRIYNRGMEVSMSLDKENKNPAYLLGRLFAVLEKAQTDALGKKINATIKDRFFSSASATPKAVFPQLLRLSQHYIEKAEYGRLNDKRIEELLCDVQDFPAHLSLDEQGVFILGYYHQRHNFFIKRESQNQNQ